MRQVLIFWVVPFSRDSGPGLTFELEGFGLRVWGLRILLQFS